MGASVLQLLLLLRLLDGGHVWLREDLLLRLVLQQLGGRGGRWQGQLLAALRLRLNGLMRAGGGLTKAVN